MYFIDLALTAGSTTYSRNTYWLTNPMDELDWSASNFYITPVKVWRLLSFHPLHVFEWWSVLSHVPRKVAAFSHVFHLD